MHKSLNIILGVVIGLVVIFAIRSRTPGTPAPAASPAFMGGSQRSPQPQVMASPVPRPREPSQARPERLEDFLKAQDVRAEWSVHRNEAGQVTGIMGGRLPLRGDPARFLSSISPYLIGQSPEFREAAAASVEGPLAATRTYRQMASGYEVYGAAARISVNHGDNAVSEISSDLRKVDAVDTTISVELREAEERLRTQFAKREIVELTGTNRPLVFGRTPEVNELAWQFRVVTSKPKRQHREILVSARDGRTLLDRSVISH